MRYEEILEETRQRGAFNTPDEAERALLVAARVFGELLVTDESVAVAEALPEPLASRVLGAEWRRTPDLDAIYDRIARGEGVAKSVAAEHGSAALQVLGEALPDDVRLRLQKHLGHALAPLLEPRVPVTPQPRPVHAAPAVDAGRGVTLATGRPGSRHPLSEDAADRTQSESVVRVANPHGDTKLSSSPGLTQERLRETLAEGEPGASAPLSDTKR